jgi:hypothetical protein
MFAFSIAIVFLSGTATANPLVFGFESSETGQPSGNTNELMCSGNCPVSSGDVSRSGSRSIKAVVDRLNSPTPYRTEVSHLVKLDVNKGTATTEYWIGFSVYVPSPYPVLNSPTYEIIYQMHSTPPDGDWSNYGAYNPNMGLRIIPTSSTGGDFLFDTRGSDSSYPQLPSNKPPTTFSGIVGSYKTNEWNDFVIHIRLDSKNGFTKLWLNGTQKVNASGSNYYRGHGPSYPKYGMYNGWRERDINESVTKRTVYHDEYRYGWGSGISYSSVAPGGGLPSEINLTAPDGLRVIED